MTEKIEKIKESLRNDLGPIRYNDICDFMEEIFLQDYDLLVLMARKFYNFFLIFHKIYYDDYADLGIPFENNGKIVSDRALPLLQRDLADGKYKKIIIADDIIIHGRSVTDVRNMILGWNQSLDVQFKAYYRNKDKNIVKGDLLDLVQARYIVDSDEWKKLSDQIVGTFFLSGQPYISYLPYFELNIDWEELLEKLEEYTKIESEEMAKYDIEGIIYSDDTNNLNQCFKKFNALSFCSYCNVRFYKYENIDSVIAVPYFMMDSVPKIKIDILSNYVRKEYFSDEYQSLLTGNEADGDIRIRELEYTFSTWLAFYLFEECGISVKEWNRNNEVYSFSGSLLKNTNWNIHNIDYILTKMQDIELSDQKEISRTLDKNFDRLMSKYGELKVKYTQEYLTFLENDRTWRIEQTGYVRRFIMDFLSCNGRVDEEIQHTGDNSNKNAVLSKRLFGIPVPFLINNMTEFFSDLFCLRDKKGVRNQVVAALISAVDAGRGTIITRTIEEMGQDYYESLIYAGEQNYKFYEESNFLVMYGFYIIEQKVNRREDVVRLKHKFAKDYEKYMNGQMLYCNEKEILELADFNISEDFGEYLYSTYQKYCANRYLQDVIKMAGEMCNV